MSGVNMNRVILTGNLTRDIEYKVLESGTRIASIRLAVNGRIKRGEEWEDKANYFDVTAFGGQAENANKYLSKGSPIAIDGRLDFQEWEKDGEKRSKVVVIADNIQYLPSGQERQSGGGGSSSEPSAEPAAATTPAAKDDDDIPF